jgi:membrane protein YfhO
VTSQPRSSRKEHGLAALVYALLLLAWFPDVAFRGRTFQTSSFVYGVAGPSGSWGYEGNRPKTWPVVDPGASGWQYEPQTYEIHDAIARGELPLWNPHAGFGEPLAANLNSNAFAPMRWPLQLATSPWLFDVFLAARLFVAAFFAYLFARRVGVGWLGAVTAGATFGLGGYFVLLVNMTHLDVEIWLPVLFLAADRLAANPDRRGIAWLGIATALPCLGGNPESVSIALLVAAAFLAFRSRLRWPVLWRGAAGFALGPVLAAPLLVPALEYLAHSANAHPNMIGLVKEPLNTVVFLLVPNFFGPVQRVWGTIDPWIRWGALGAVPCVVGIAGLACRRPDRLHWFFGGLVLVAYMKLLGVPPVQWLGRLPILDVVIFTKHLHPIVEFALGLLAAFAIDRLERENRGRFAIGVGATVVVLLIGLAAWRFRRAAETAGAWPATFGAVAIEAFLALGVAVVAAIRRPRLAVAGIALALASDLWVQVPRDRADRFDPRNEPPFLAALRGGSTRHRIAGFDGVLFPNWAGVFGIDDLRSLNGLSVGTSRRWVTDRIEPLALDRFTGTETAAPDLLGPAIDEAGIDRLVSLSPIEDVATRLFVARAHRSQPEEDDVGPIPASASRRGAEAFRVHPGSSLTRDIELPPRAAKLSVDVAATTERATIRVSITEPGERVVLLDRFLDPSNHASERGWNEERLVVPPGRGLLTFSTGPGPRNFPNCDWGLYAEPRLEPGGPLLGDGLRGFETRAPGRNNVVGTGDVIDGDARRVLFVAAPSEARTQIAAPETGAVLRFAIAFPTRVTADHLSDGADFRVLWEPVMPETRLVEAAVDVEGRRVEADLSPWSGRRVRLRITCDGAPTEWSRMSPEVFGRHVEPILEGPVHVYGNSFARQRAFFVSDDRVVRVPSGDEALERCARPSFDATTAVVETPAPGSTPIQRDPSAAVPPAAVEISSYGAASVSVEVSAPEPGWLVLLDAYYPGWVATVDGSPTPIRRADGAFRAVAIDEGHHHVAFEYRPASFRVGIGLCVAGLAVVAWIFATSRRPRASETAAPAQFPAMER